MQIFKAFFTSTENDDDEFWQTLGDRGPIKPANEGGDDLQAEQQFYDSMVLYK